MFGLAGQVAIVTGALGRLGREYVKVLAQAGARVGAIDIAGDRTLFAPLAGQGLAVHVEIADLTRKAEADRAVGGVVAALGPAAILVNNAGLGSSPASAGSENGPFEDYPEAAWDAMIDSHLKSALFVEALQGVGASTARILFLHILPNAASPIIVRATIGMGFTILTAAVLGFLGVGATPPDPDWGLAIAESRKFLPETWWFATFPGLAILIAVLGFNLLGDGLRDLVDPRLRRSR